MKGVVLDNVFGRVIILRELDWVRNFADLVWGSVHGEVRLKFILGVKEGLAFLSNGLPVCLRLQALFNHSCYLM